MCGQSPKPLALSCFVRGKASKVSISRQARTKQMPRRLSVTGGVRGEVELRLYNWPAREEYRLLQALAFDATLLDGPHLPLRFRLAASLLPDVTAVLEGLAIPIQYDQTIDPATWSADSSKPTKQ